MYKLVVLFAILTVGAAKPHHTGHNEPVYTVKETHSLEKVGEIVQHVPTAVSHQSSTIVHNKPVVTPVIVPIVEKTIVAEHEPVIHVVEHKIVNDEHPKIVYTVQPDHHATEHKHAHVEYSLPENHSHYEHDSHEDSDDSSDESDEHHYHYDSHSESDEDEDKHISEIFSHEIIGHKSILKHEVPVSHPVVLAQTHYEHPKEIVHHQPATYEYALDPKTILVTPVVKYISKAHDDYSASDDHHDW